MVRISRLEAQNKTLLFDFLDRLEVGTVAVGWKAFCPGGGGGGLLAAADDSNPIMVVAKESVFCH